MWHTCNTFGTGPLRVYLSCKRDMALLHSTPWKRGTPAIRWMLFVYKHSFWQRKDNFQFFFRVVTLNVMNIKA